MSISFITATPQQLLDSFISHIEQAERKGQITTWVRSQDGKFFTHKAPEWKGKAWFFPRVEAGKLRFTIAPSKDSSVTVVSYGYYHGHLNETFLNHFDGDFSVAQSTARPDADDKVK